MDPRDVVKEMGRRWKALTDAQKQPYNDDALNLKNEYLNIKMIYDKNKNNLTPINSEEESIDEIEEQQINNTELPPVAALAPVTKLVTAPKPKKPKQAAPPVVHVVPAVADSQEPPLTIADPVATASASPEKKKKKKKKKSTANAVVVVA